MKKQHDNAQLESAIALLRRAYERALKLDFVKNKAAWALYHTWKLVDNFDKIYEDDEDES